MILTGSYKGVHPKAVIVEGLDGLVEKELGERVIQEAELLRERFGGRKKGCDFVLRQNKTEVEEQDGSEGYRICLDTREESAGKTVFTPRFPEDRQRNRLKEALESLLPPQGDSKAREVYRMKQSHITAPLGIALYRLNLWTRSLALTPPTQSNTKS